MSAFSLFSLGWVGLDGKSLCCLILNMHATQFSYEKITYSSHIKEETIGFKKNVVRNRLIWRQRKQVAALSWFQCVICQKGTTENTKCPVNCTGNGSTLACTESLIFEQDLTSFYETGKLNLAVDCRGNVLTWKWNSASILSSHLLCGKNLIAMSSTGPNWSHDGMKNFCN